jgi:hypothetical protein
MVWSDGYEGRFLQWSGDLWEAYDYANFRHSFSAAQELNDADLRALRVQFRIPEELLPDEQLSVTAPMILQHLKAERA